MNRTRLISFEFRLFSSGIDGYNLLFESPRSPHRSQPRADLKFSLGGGGGGGGEFSKNF